MSVEAETEAVAVEVVEPGARSGGVDQLLGAESLQHQAPTSTATRAWSRDPPRFRQRSGVVLSCLSIFAPACTVPPRRRGIAPAP